MTAEFAGRLINCSDRFDSALVCFLEVTDMVSADPPYHFVAYIDEAGDDGLRAVKPLSSPGSSEWLILSAVVIRASNQAKVVDWVTRIRSGLYRHRQARGLHFTDLSDVNKIAACEEISDLDLRCFVVASNKKNMEGHTNPDAAKIPSQCWFYCWMTRILLERVTDFVFHRAMEEYGEPRYVRLEYSARGGLKYSQMNAYYSWMRMKKHKPFLPWGKIQFDVLHANLFKVYPHDQREGLQLSDIIASSFFKACDKHDTGACDPQFAKLLRSRMARKPDIRSGQISGYGVKLLPNMGNAKLDDDQAEIFKFYGYPQQWWDPKAFSK